MKKIPESDQTWFCTHCDREIKNKDTAWSRSGSHWCSKGCYDQDYHLRIKDVKCIQCGNLLYNQTEAKKFGYTRCISCLRKNFKKKREGV